MCGTTCERKSRIGLSPVLWMAIVIALCAGVAVEAQAPDANQPIQMVTPMEGVEVQGKVEGGRVKLIAFEKNCPIKDALRILAALYEKNIVPSGKVDGVLGFSRLLDVTFDEALSAVLGTTFVAEEDGQLIRVFPKEEYKRRLEELEQAEAKRKKELADPARMVCKVFTLYYISATEAAPLVQSVLSTNGSVKASSKAQAALPTGQSISGGSGGGDSMAVNDTLVVKDYPENIPLVEAMLKDLDVRPLQVLVEATILTASLTNDTQFGIDWKDLASVSGATVSLATKVSPIAGKGAMSIGVFDGDAEVLIDALEEITDTTVLATPKIMAINKQLGQVYIGTKLGYRDQETISSSGVATAGTVKFLDTGTKLAFRPYIGNDGYIRMDIHPKDSTGELKVDATGNIPQEKAVELATNILVKDGQTVIIGGLFRDKTTRTKTQVPVLGSIPIVGLAFKGSTDAVTREEVVVLLTPHILDEPDAAAGEMAKIDIDRKKSGAKNELMAIDNERITEDFYTKAARSYLAGDAEKAMDQVKLALALRPTHLEAIRLKERILAEASPEEYERLERIVRRQIAEED